MSQRRCLIFSIVFFFLAVLNAVLVWINISQQNRIAAIRASVQTTYTADAEGRMIPDRIIVQAPDVPHTVLSQVPVPPCGATSTRAVPEK